MICRCIVFFSRLWMKLEVFCNVLMFVLIVFLFLLLRNVIYILVYVRLWDILILEMVVIMFRWGFLILCCRMRVIFFCIFCVMCCGWLNFFVIINFFDKKGVVSFFLKLILGGRVVYVDLIRCVSVILGNLCWM